MPSITSIKLDVSSRLRDAEFRKAFFRARAADEIALSIRDLRTKRKKRQADLANESGMKQSAISRIEQADYGNWTLKTLFRIADTLDARLRIVFDPLEEVISQYKEREIAVQQQGDFAIYRKSDASAALIQRTTLAETPDRKSLETGQSELI